MEKILVAVDGSDHAARAVDVAAELAAKYGAQLIVLHVMTGGAYEVPSGMQEYGEIERMYQTERDILAGAAETIVSEAATRVTSAGLAKPDTMIVVGRAASSIVDTAESLGTELIVVGSRGLGGGAGVFDGSVSNRVNQLARCSVLTVR
jgi:nucleotide-binding universal stress UspA family protein